MSFLPAELDPQYLDRDLRAQMHELKQAHLYLARQDPAAFASYVLRDDETGLPILLSPLHLEWHRLADKHDRLLIWSHVESGKTQQMSVARALFMLGQNPNLRICIISNTHGQAEKVCRTIAKYIETSVELREVFPELQRAPGMPWSSSRLFVKRASRANDASVQTTGIHGNLLGSRVDRLIIDDLLDYENTISPSQRDDLANWFKATVETRLTRKSRVLCIGTAWHRDDIMHRWAKSPEWHAVRYGVIDSEGNPTWPARWPLDRIERVRGILGPVEFARSLLCVARTDDESRFKQEWIETCLARGEGKRLCYALEAVPEGYSTYTGVDLSVGYANSDWTVLFTIAVAPNGDRVVLNIESGRWKGPEIVQKIVDTYNRYQSIMIVENNAAQEYIVQFTKQMSAVPVRSFTTGRNKTSQEFGLETLAVEMSNGKWVIPSDGPGQMAPEVRKWVEEMLYYDPAGHPGDRLMASWFAREGSRMTKPKVQFGQLNLTRR